MGGRPRKPIELKLLQGTLDNRRVPASPPVVENTDIPLDPPDDLTDERARKEWSRVAGVLHKAGLLRNPDESAFRTYCESYSEWRAAGDEVRKKGMFVRINGWKKRSVDERGKPVVEIHEGETITNPAMKMKLAIADQMRRFMQEFGMTPASRSRIDLGLPKQPAEDKPKSGFAGMA
jgi:P27 family predicted phage terminase small subunit